SPLTFSASHSFVEEGSFAYQWSLTAAIFVDSVHAEGAGSVAVADAGLVGEEVAVSYGGDGVVSAWARFADADPLGSVADLSAVVEWGDGSRSQVAVSMFQ